MGGGCTSVGGMCASVGGVYVSVGGGCASVGGVYVSVRGVCKCGRRLYKCDSDTILSKTQSIPFCCMRADLGWEN